MKVPNPAEQYVRSELCGRCLPDRSCQHRKPTQRWLNATSVDFNAINLQSMIKELRSLAGNQKFINLDNRRGLDFHRRRPQSLLHSSHPAVSKPLLGGRRLWAWVDRHQIHEPNAIGVFNFVTAALSVVAEAIRVLATPIGPALRDYGIPVDLDVRFNKQRQDVIGSDWFGDSSTP